MHIKLLSLLFILLIACSDRSGSDDNTIYLSGEIDNPKNDFITFNRSPTEVDTINLGDDNRFKFEIKDLEPGIYSFTHGGEYQLVVLEANDSLALRLNTRDFDESLVFTGKGAKKNNFLMKLYLEHENEHKVPQEVFKLEPEDFHQYIDSLRLVELDEVKKFNDDRNSSELFRKVTEATVNYNYYAFKEFYPFKYFGYDKLIHYKDAPDNFYAFRSDVDINDVTFKKMPVFQGYLSWYFKNAALQEFYKDGNHLRKFNKQSLAFNKQNLKLIDSGISDSYLESYLMKNVIREFIDDEKDPDKINSLVSLYNEYSEIEADKDFVNKMVNAHLYIREGNRLPDITLISTRNDHVNINELVEGKPSLIYFWSTNRTGQARRSHSIVRKLKDKYPQIQFIGINVNEYQPFYWKQTLKENKFIPDNEYYFRNAVEGVISLSADLNNAIMVDKEGVIVGPKINLFTQEIEKTIDSYQENLDLPKPDSSI